MAKNIDFWTLLKMTQEYISSHYAAVLTDKAKLSQLKAKQTSQYRFRKLKKQVQNLYSYLFTIRKLH